jgi:hypothetical protein
MVWRVMAWGGRSRSGGWKALMEWWAVPTLHTAGDAGAEGMRQRLSLRGRG